jgi:dihydrofolate reductase
VTVSIIVAMSSNRVIGRAGDLPWRLPADLRHFKALTVGHAVIMGRRTFDSVGRPLPERRCIVITRDRNYRPEGVIVAHDLEEAIGCAAADDDEVFIAGGGEIYRLALPLADRMYVTVVHAQVEGDTYFPELDESEWEMIADERHEADDRHAHAYSFRVYERSDRS